MRAGIDSGVAALFKFTIIFIANYLPNEHKSYDLFRSIAVFSVLPDAAKAAKEQGLFVLKRVGQVVKTDAKEMRAFG